MFIQGLNSLNVNAQPLIVIDGVIVEQQYGREMIHSGFYNDILNNINPNDIENVTVLRNGTALYGAKGANGVILIQTRRNKSMATRITATLSAGVTLEPKMISMMNAEQYRGYASEALVTAIDELFRRGFKRVCAGYFEGNDASRRVMEKSGMKPTKEEAVISYRGVDHRCLFCEITHE